MEGSSQGLDTGGDEVRIEDIKSRCFGLGMDLLQRMAEHPVPLERGVR